jgi:predicted nucleic acid-binding protein
MIVVSDTGPLNYLILMEAIDVLRRLYPRVILPASVADELQQKGAPSAVQAWIAKPPTWLEAKPDPPFDPTLAFLDRGERAALALAESSSADLLLIDDLAGRVEAERRQIRVTGTLGILAEAHLAGLLIFDDAVARLRSTNFRLSQEAERSVRKRMGRS